MRSDGRPTVGGSASHGGNTGNRTLHTIIEPPETSMINMAHTSTSTDTSAMSLPLA
jgi:hypothetical protein